MRPSWDYMSPVKTIIPWVGWVGFIGALCWGGWNQIRIHKFQSIQQDIHELGNELKEFEGSALAQAITEAGVQLHVCKHQQKKKLQKITIGDAYTYTPGNQRHEVIAHALKDGESFGFFDLPGVEVFAIENKKGQWSKKMDEKFFERLLSQDWTISK